MGRARCRWWCPHLAVAIIELPGEAEYATQFRVIGKGGRLASNFVQQP